MSFFLISSSFLSFNQNFTRSAYMYLYKFIFVPVIFFSIYTIANACWTVQYCMIHLQDQCLKAPRTDINQFKQGLWRVSLSLAFYVQSELKPFVRITFSKNFMTEHCLSDNIQHWYKPITIILMKYLSLFPPLSLHFLLSHSLSFFYHACFDFHYESPEVLPQ